MFFTPIYNKKLICANFLNNFIGIFIPLNKTFNIIAKIKNKPVLFFSNDELDIVVKA